MPSSRSEILTYVRAQRLERAIPDEDFAAAAGVSEDELRAFEAGEAPVPELTLAAMLGALASHAEPAASSRFAPGFSDAPQRQFAQPGEERRFSESVQLIEAFAAISSQADRDRILALATDLAAKAAGGR